MNAAAVAETRPAFLDSVSWRVMVVGIWNVIIAYANCNHDPRADFPAPGPSDDPWGPNESCFP